MLPIQPMPPRVRIALGFLFALSTLYLVVGTLPVFAPENIFVRTQTRLQAPVDVLFSRLEAVRPLTPSDDTLRAKFVNLESRLLYAQFGPAVLADCPFCNADEPKSYLYYAVPLLLWPHVANLVVIAAVTSPALTGKYGAPWRTLAVIAAVTLAVVETYFVAWYNYQANSRALRLPEVDFFYWDMRSYRLLALAALNGALGWVLYLSSTNRAFARLPSPAERIDDVSRALLHVKSALNAVCIVKNTAMRDEELRARSQAYWAHEVRVMREVMEERDVIEGVNDALSNRIDIDRIAADATTYAESVLEPLRQQESDA